MSKEFGIVTLEIIYPTHAETHFVNWVEIESPNGNFTVSGGHAPLISKIKKKGVVSFETQEGTITQKEIIGGIFSVTNDRAVIIAE